MMYAYMTLPDKTEIVHSHSYMADGKEQVKVYMEQPIHLGFKTATCYLPEYRWEDINGFTDEEMEHLKDIVSSSAHLIIQFARDAGNVSDASNFLKLQGI